MAKSRAEQEFQDLLEGKSSSKASDEAAQLAALATALRPAAAPAPSQSFKRRLRSELLAKASMTDEDVFAELLEGSPAEAPAEIRPLVAVASALKIDEPASPSPAFRFQLRNELIKRAEGQASPARRMAAWFARTNRGLQRKARFVSAMGMAVMMLFGSSLVFAAASNSLPGDALYSVKRLHESARLSLLSGEAEGRTRLELARTRMGEITELTRRDVRDEQLYLSTLDTMDRFTTSGTRLLLDVFEQTGNTAPVEFVASFAGDQVRDLSAIVEQLPPGARSAARDSLSLAQRTADQAERTLSGCGVCPDDPLLTSPTSGNKTTDGASCDCVPVGTPVTGDDPATTDDGDSSPKGDKGGSNDPGDSNDGGSDPRTVDAPDDLPDEVEDPVEDIINDILDEIEESLPPLPSPLPSPSLPSTGDLGL